ncbi:MAG: hypothetical protein ABW221_06055 [Vicinamibacteria bacterium]
MAEVSATFLRKLLRGAWKSGGKMKLGEPPEPGTIPEALEIPNGTPFGSFTVVAGQIQIPQHELDVSLVAGQGVDVKIGVVGNAELKSAIVPSLKLVNILADVHVVASIGRLTGPGHGTNDVGVQLNPAPTTNVTLTGPDPGAKLDELLVEQFRSLAASTPSLGTLPGIVVTYQSAPAYTVKERLEVRTDALHAVEAVRVPGAPPRIVLKVPVRWSLFSIVPDPAADPAPPLLEGVLVDAILKAGAILEDDPTTPGGHQVRLTAATTTIDVDSITPTGAVDHFTGNQARLGPEFDSIVLEHIGDRGRQLLAIVGNLAINVPTVPSIQNALAKLISDAMIAVGSITIWQPKDTPGGPLVIRDPSVKVLPDALVLGINPGPSADAGALTSFLPAGRDLAFGISAEGVANIFEEITTTQNIFRRYSADGDEFDLHSLTLSLKPGALHFEGEMTVIDAIAFSLDVDASFKTDVRLAWKPGNELVATPDEPEVETDMSVLAWVVSLILGFITAGGMGVVIAIVVLKVCEAVAANIGSDITKDPNFTAVAAWPQKLPQIGTVRADFDNPIDIDTDGLLFAAKVEP